MSSQAAYHLAKPSVLGQHLQNIGLDEDKVCLLHEICCVLLLCSSAVLCVWLVASFVPRPCVTYSMSFHTASKKRCLRIRLAGCYVLLFGYCAGPSVCTGLDCTGQVSR